MEAVEHMLNPLNMRCAAIHEDRLQVALSLIDPREQLMDTLATAFKEWRPMCRHYYDDLCPGCIVLFWKAEYMSTCHLYTALLDSFSNEELVHNPDAAVWSPG